MGMRLTDIVRLGLEVTRGTAPETLPMHIPVLMPGLVPTSTGHNAVIESSSTFPHVTRNVPIGVTHALALTPEINTGTIRDLILLATKATGAAFPSITIGRSGIGVQQEIYTGCVVSRAEYGYASQGAEPGDDAVFSGTWSFETMQRSTTSGLVAGTQAFGRHFVLKHGTFTINSVAASKVLSYRHTIERAFAAGRPDGSNKRLYIEDGIMRHSAQILARFESAAWKTLLNAQTQHACEFVHSTGTVNETFTETLGACQLSENAEADQDGMVTEQISIISAWTGAAAAMVPTFGSAIAASELSL